MVFAAVGGALVWAHFKIQTKESNYIIVIVNSKNQTDDDQFKLVTLGVLSPQYLQKDLRELDIAQQTDKQLQLLLNQIISNEKLDHKNMRMMNNHLSLLLHFKYKEETKYFVEKIIFEFGKLLSFLDSVPSIRIKKGLSNNLALYYFRRQNYKKASKLYRYSLKVKNEWQQLLALGLIEIKKKNLVQAKHYFSQSLKMSSEMPKHLFYFTFANYLKKSNFNIESLEYYKQALRENEDFLPAKLNTAVVLKKIKKFDEAESLYNEILMQNKNYFNANYNLGLLLKDRARYDGAIKSLKAAILLNKSHQGARTTLADLYFKQKKYPEALELYLWVLKKSPSDVKASYEVANCYIKMAKTKLAQKYYMMAIEKSGGSYTWAWLKLGQIQEKLGELDKAEEHYLDSIQLNPSFAGGHAALGKLHFKRGNYGKALEYYKKSIKIRPQASLYYRRVADTYIKEKNYKEASGYLKQAIKIDPESILTNLDYGNILSKLGKYHEAEKYLKFVIKKRPYKSSVWNRLGKNQAKSKQYEQSIISFNKSLETADQEDTKFLSIVTQRKIKSLVKQNKLTEAQLLVGKLIEMRGDYVDAHILAAQIASKSNRDMDVVKSLNLALNFTKDECKTLRRAKKIRRKEFEKRWKQVCQKL
jgi:tetratricopeptide (TPR) repeat protein